MENKNIIAIEISTELCSIAIKYNKRIFTKYKFINKKKNQYILLLINKIIKKNNIKINKIKYIIINKGPGSIIGSRMSNNISELFKLKNKKIKIIKLNSFRIILNNLKIKKKIKKNIFIIIYNNINNIIIYNKKKIKKYNSMKKIKKLLFLNKNLYIIVNNYQLKNKIKKFYKKKINIIYPKAKYMLFYNNNNLY